MAETVCPLRMFAVMIVSDAIVIGLGYAWLAHLIGGDKAWAFGVLPFLLGDALKIAIRGAVGVGGQFPLPARLIQT